MKTNEVLRVEQITKSFPGVKALDGVSFEVHAGECLALLGENGAGKSTLIKIIAGVQPCDSGNIVFDGKPVKFKNPTEAKEAGISVVYQELANVPLLTVAENLFINRYGTSGKVLNWKAMYEEAETILKNAELHVDVKKKMGDCNVAEKQQIEIARAIYENAKLIILDEPSSALNNTEISNLMNTIQQLKAKGLAIILITHKMDEIFAVADSVVVLRDGVSVAQRNIKETTEDELITMMVGREIKSMYPPKDNHPGEVFYSAKNLNNQHVKDVSFDLRRGEILGIYGLMGSGHQELGKTLFGCVPKSKGSIMLDDKEINFSNPKKCIAQGVAYLPSERKEEGLVQIQSVAVNIMTSSYEAKNSPRFINFKKEREIGKKWIIELAVKANGPETITGTLSGGNQQKVILAKWLELKPNVIILNEPTRGIDVGSKAEIYKLLNKMCKEGISVIMITSEMPELLAMANRVLVMHEGRLQTTLNEEQMTENNVMIAAIGGNIHEEQNA